MHHRYTKANPAETVSLSLRPVISEERGDKKHRHNRLPGGKVKWVIFLNSLASWISRFIRSLLHAYSTTSDNT